MHCAPLVFSTGIWSTTLDCLMIPARYRRRQYWRTLPSYQHRRNQNNPADVRTAARSKGGRGSRNAFRCATRSSFGLILYVHVLFVEVLRATKLLNATSARQIRSPSSTRATKNATKNKSPANKKTGPLAPHAFSSHPRCKLTPLFHLRRYAERTVAVATRCDGAGRASAARRARSSSGTRRRSRRGKSCGS